MPLHRLGGYAVQLTKGLQTNDFEAALPVDEQMDANERIRLLYVATTRARDHLVVSLHRATSGARTNAVELAEAGAADGVESFVGDPAASGRSAARSEVEPPPDWAPWQAWLTAAQATSRRWTVSASGLEGTEPEVVLPVNSGPASPGEADTAPGRADPAPGDPGAARAPGMSSCPSGRRADTGRRSDARRTGRCRAWTWPPGRGWSRPSRPSASPRASSTSPPWSPISCGQRSTRRLSGPQRRGRRCGSPSSAQDEDGTVLEGIIDLMYRDHDGTVVIVDYKTDAVPAAAPGARVEFYRPQVLAYRRAVQAATGSATRAVLLFLNPGGLSWSRSTIGDASAGSQAEAPVVLGVDRSRSSHGAPPGDDGIGGPAGRPSLDRVAPAATPTKGWTPRPSNSC